MVFSNLLAYGMGSLGIVNSTRREVYVDSFCKVEVEYMHIQTKFDLDLK